VREALLGKKARRGDRAWVEAKKQARLEGAHALWKTGKKLIKIQPRELKSPCRGWSIT
jgi:hypothetical protein